MSTITRYQAKDLRNAFECWQQDYDPVEDKEQYDMFGLGIVAMDALLASLEAEPMESLHSKSVFNINHESSLIKHVKKVVRDTSSPPAPVSVPDEATPENIEILASTFAPRGVTYQWDRDECNAAADSWNACRAAMLQGAEPVSNRDELPLDYLQGHRDGLEWAAQLAEANHPQTGDWLYDDPVELAKAIRNGPDMPDSAGNSPVIPDGLRLALSNAGIAAPESDELLFATHEKYIQMLVTWVKDRKPFQTLQAAPQQEVM